MMVCLCKWNSMAQVLLLASAVFATASYRSRKREESSPSSQARHYPSTRGYSLFKHSRYYASSRYSATHHGGAIANNEFPAGTFKRTTYTGRYCAYLKTKMVKHRVPNGTETYLKQVVTKCHWSAVYCTPRINYVVSTRRTYKTVMKEVKKEEWSCCPGFTGDSCEIACFNCTIMNDLKEKVADLEAQLSGENTRPQTGRPSESLRRGRKGPKGEPGPIGPRGLTGENGALGPRGPVGLQGQKGVAGEPGPIGPRGLTGEEGKRGARGLPGEAGVAGAPGVNGSDGRDGETGRPGPKGETGLPGIAGSPGERGIRGPEGEVGPRGPAGPAGVDGRPGSRGEPGPPGQCGCQSTQSATTADTTTTSPAATTKQGSAECLYEGKPRAEDETWTNEDCEECFCIEGTVTCLPITCPELECIHKYKPAEYCCEICCRYQNDDDYLGELSILSGSSGDGAYESMLPEYDDGYGEGNDTLNLIDVARYDTYGCPLPTLGENLSKEMDVIERCQLIKDPGPCKRRYQRYYFDIVQQQCRLFVYGGCEGNANSFLSREECQQTCQPVAGSAPAALHDSRCTDDPQVVGTCKLSEPRFSYDAGTGRCHKFIYHGCAESRNNFYSPGECQTACKAGDPVYHGFVIRGGLINDEIGGPDNLIADSPHSTGTQRCYAPKEIGDCRGSFVRFYFDAAENRCKSFVYGGCGGNNNNFMTPWECRESCGGKDPLYFADDYVCSLSPERGSCRMSLQSYYYDEDTGRCKVFAWGGCDSPGPENRFETEEECFLTCGERGVTAKSAASPVCREPPHPGPCRAHMYRFFYDSVTEKCSTFVYGGCNANGNNFETPELCMQTCGGQRVNYTVTEFASSGQSSSGEGQRGPPGLPGIKGDRGPAGPPGPKGDSASLDAYMEEIRNLKSQVAELAAMVLSHVAAYPTSEGAGGLGLGNGDDPPNYFGDGDIEDIENR